MLEAPFDAAQAAAARAFLFDLDGTLVDSSGAHEKAFRSALHRVSEEAARAFVYAPHKGKRTRETFHDLGIETPDLLADLVARKQAAYRELVAAGAVGLFAGARDLLAALAACGRRAFIVTGASRRSTDEVLARHAIARLFAGMITADDVTRGKPHPEPFLEALRRFGLTGAESLVIEDAASGIESARAAGLRVIGVNDAGLAGADLLGATLAELHATLAPHLARCPA